MNKKCNKKCPRRGKRKQTQLRMTEKDRAVFCALQVSIQDLTQQQLQIQQQLHRISSSNITAKAPENLTPEQAYEQAYQLGRLVGKQVLQKYRQFDQ